MKWRYGFLIFIAVLVGCTDENLSTEEVTLEGKWIEVNTKTDTLTFGLFGDQKFMILGSGKEIRNGYLLPKMGSGFYDYRLLASDSISLHWTLSSSGIFNTYYFKQSGDKLIIEKFFDTTTSGAMLTFKKAH